MLCPSWHHSILLVNTQEAVFRLDINEQLLNGALDINTRRQKRKKHVFEKLMFFRFIIIIIRDTFVYMCFVVSPRSENKFIRPLMG